MKKSTTKIMVIALVVVAVAVAVWYLLKGKKDDVVVVDKPNGNDIVVKYINGAGYLFDSLGSFIGSWRNKKDNSGNSGSSAPEAPPLIDFGEEEDEVDDFENYCGYEE